MKTVPKVTIPDETIPAEVIEKVEFEDDSLKILSADTIPLLNQDPIVINTDSIAKAAADMEYYGKEISFNPNPNRAVWLSALFPGLGQVYNRRYWKLPLVVGGFMGISYAMTWNGKMLTDYTNAYRDAMDNDPNSKSYLNFLPPGTKEASINMEWLRKTLKSRKDMFRRNRDLSIICMAGLYLICMVDAYVDASLSHFDITPDLSMQVSPAFIENNKNGIPSVGVQCALKF